MPYLVKLLFSLYLLAVFAGLVYTGIKIVTVSQDKTRMKGLKHVDYPRLIMYCFLFPIFLGSKESQSYFLNWDKWLPPTLNSSLTETQRKDI